ncbi:MAG: HAD family hydrolase [Eubacteriales bacterium]|nr:HAD family hydrolase [Eubacteriales bacterium]
MNKKVIFLDIDGTFTEPGCNDAPESAVRAVEEARRNGHYVFLCTGRNYDMLKPVLQYDFDGVIASAGGYVVYRNEVIFDCPMTPEQQEKVLTVLEKNGIFRTVECKDGSFTDDSFKEFLKANAGENGNSEFLRWREQIEKSLNIRSMKEYDGRPVYKVVIMASDEAMLEEPKRVLEEEFLFSIQDKDQRGIINGELINRRFDKGQAVVRVCEHLGIPVEDSIGFGDSVNDREMLEVCGVSVCMANGSESMKAIADYVCPAVTEDGLAAAFRKYHLTD